MDFAVIIPTQDRSALLARALASAVSQTYPASEIIVVDDGSSSEQASEIATLVAGTPGARLLRNDRVMGAPAARNRAIRETSCEWIATLDSDDWWRPDRLERHRQALAAGPAVLSYNRAGLTSSGDKEVFAMHGAAPPTTRAPAISLLGWNYIGGCSSVCFSRSAFERAGGFLESLPSCQDWDLWLRLLRQGDLAFIDEVLSYQDFGPHERITTARAKVEAGHQHIRRIAAHASMRPKDRRYVRAHQLRTEAEIALRFGEPGEGLKLLLGSIGALPTLAAMRRFPPMLRGSIRRRAPAARIQA